MTRPTRLQPGVYLEATAIFMEAMPVLERARALMPPKLDDEFDEILDEFEDQLNDCQVREQLIDDLYEVLAHGNAEHRAWLRQVLEGYFHEP